MRKTSILLSLLLATVFSFGQIDQDTITTKEVVVTANRYEKEIDEIPAKIELIKSTEIEQMPVNNLDDVFNSVSNVNVNRSWGPFSKNSSVTMRGLSSSARTLILLDGVPLNVAAGGSVNWHMIDPDNVARIEITKGPNSALYGNNAMGGVINIITKKPNTPLSISSNTYIGSYQTFGQHLRVTGSKIKEDKGLYWGLNGFGRKGNGYFFDTEASRDYTDTTTFIWEYNGGGYLGYQFNGQHKLEVSLDYYDDLRNIGIQVFEKNGNYYKFTNAIIKANYWGRIKGFNITANAYRKQQNYFNQKEKINSGGEYKLVESSSIDIDEGIWIGIDKMISEKNHITFGTDLKHGNTDYQDIYFTSPDEVYYNGDYHFFALFAQDEHDFNRKFKLVSGLRFDYAHFYNGDFTVKNPSSATAYPRDIYDAYTEQAWSALSFKLAINYKQSEILRHYFSIASGFNPPKLDDLCRSGKISKGIKVANPELKPEKLYNIEAGTFITLDKLSIEPALYYSRGIDFHYLVNLGENVDLGSEVLPLLQKQNISDMEIIGAEINVKYQILNNLRLSTNYSYNYSTILKYHSMEGNDLSGKYAVEVPPHQFYAGLFYQFKNLNTSLSYRFTDEQWVDDANTQKVEGYSIFDFKMSYTLKKHFQVYVDIQNLFDVEFVDRKGYPSPGRYVLLGLKINYNKQ